MKTASEIRRIKDPWARAAAAQDALNKLAPRERAARARRDVAALVLIAPYARAAQESNEFRAAAKAAYQGYWGKPDGEIIATTEQAAAQYQRSHPDVEIVYYKPSIRYDQYIERLEEARKMRDAAFAEAKGRGEQIMEPVAVYEALGMHRNLLVRLKKRQSGLPDMPNPMEEGLAAKKELAPLTEKTTALREIRDGAIDDLIAEAIPSVDIAKHLGLSPARVTQIRQGGRR